MKIVTAVLATLLLLAGCSGSSDDEATPTRTPTPNASDPSRQFDRDTLDKQAQEQADREKAAQAELEKEVREAAEQRRTVVDITIKDGKVAPQGGRVEVAAGTPVTLLVTSDADEEIHVHSDPEHTYEVTAGGSIEKTFTIDRPGQVAVEAHGLGVTILQLVVR